MVFFSAMAFFHSSMKARLVRFVTHKGTIGLLAASLINALFSRPTLVETCVMLGLRLYHLFSSFGWCTERCSVQCLKIGFKGWEFNLNSDLSAVPLCLHDAVCSIMSSKELIRPSVDSKNQTEVKWNGCGLNLLIISPLKTLGCIYTFLKTTYSYYTLVWVHHKQKKRQ